MTVGVLGAGAFGTAVAITLAQKMPVTLWARDPGQAAQMAASRVNSARLDECPFPDALTVTSDLSDAAAADVLLIAVPMQQLRDFLTEAQPCVSAKRLVACCKGIELKTGLGPLDIMQELCPTARAALLTGPSFAQEIARGLPTALTLACADPGDGAALQQRLSTPTLRLYRTTDTIGASLGGALKNVVAIACGAAMGAGLGHSARAALMTRGNAEMQRLAVDRGARAETLSGLSGFGDLVLTCTSDQSRNYRFGLSIGAGESFDPATTVEGVATARALDAQARADNLDLPIVKAVAGLVEKRLDVTEAMSALLSRSLKEE
jgi:glycerol-3-phosphate dehydrogenase (NAD(P)+)